MVLTKVETALIFVSFPGKRNEQIWNGWKVGGASTQTEKLGNYAWMGVFDKTLPRW